MSRKTSIGWTDATVNPIRARDIRTREIGWFCEKVSPGCKNCYAERMNGWRGNGLRFAADQEPFAEMFFDAKQIDQVRRWRKPQRIFVCDMTDIGHPMVRREWLDYIFAIALIARHHILQLLTKRPKRLREYLRDDTTQERVRLLASAIAGVCPSVPWPLPNVHIGTSTENQETADARIPALLSTPAAVRFISAEPLLGPIDLIGKARFGPGYNYLKEWKTPANITIPRSIDWVIVGGESGPEARELNMEWVRNLVQQCINAKVPVFVKQLGAKPISTHNEGRGWSPLFQDRFGKESTGEWGFLDSKGKNDDPATWPEDLRVQELPE